LPRISRIQRVLFLNPLAVALVEIASAKRVAHSANASDDVVTDA